MSRLSRNAFPGFPKDRAPNGVGQDDSEFFGAF
jgi:hypothetical protein